MKDERIRNQLARVMLVGVVVAACIIAAGMVWFLAAHPGMRPGYHVFTGEPKYFTNPILMVQRALEPGVIGERRSLIMIGVVLLLINPVVRVALAAFGFAAQNDWLYTAVSLVVLAVLLFSFFG